MMGNHGRLTYAAFQAAFGVGNLVGDGKLPGDQNNKANDQEGV